MLVKTHLIVTDQYEDYRIDWYNRLIDCNPKFKNGLPIFIVISSTGRREMNTFNIKDIEKVALKSTYPRGRGSVTTDKARIYIKEDDDNEKLLGIVTHNHIRKYAPMYDDC